MHTTNIAPRHPLVSHEVLTAQAPTSRNQADMDEPCSRSQKVTVWFLVVLMWAAMALTFYLIWSKTTP